jgi:hypothetical protein
MHAKHADGSSMVVNNAVRFNTLAAGSPELAECSIALVKGDLTRYADVTDGVRASAAQPAPASAALAAKARARKTLSSLRRQLLLSGRLSRGQRPPRSRSPPKLALESGKTAVVAQETALAQRAALAQQTASCVKLKLRTPALKKGFPAWSRRRP